MPRTTRPLWTLLWILIGTLVTAGLLDAGTLEGQNLELVGHVKIPKGSHLGRQRLAVFIHSARSPFFDTTWTGFDGKFKFKDLDPGLYTLVITIPRRGTRQLTVDLSPSAADPEGRITKEIALTEEDLLPRAEVSGVVSLNKLSIPERARSEYRKALNDLKKRKTDSAVKHLQRAVERAPKFVAALNTLGTISYQHRKLKKAEDYFRRALAADPGSYLPLVNLGGVLLDEKRYGEAMEVNRRAVARNADDALANCQLGLTLLNLNRDPGAINYLERCQELDPAHFSLPQLFLARLYWKYGKTALAIKELQMLLVLHPDYPKKAEVVKLISRLKLRLKPQTPKHQ